MLYRSRPPRSALLRGLVDTIWYCEAAEAPAAELLMPTGRAQIVIGIADSAPGALIQGPMSAAAEIDTAMQRRAVGVAFSPGGLAPFVGGPVGELADVRVELGAEWGRRGSSVVSDLGELGDAAAISTRIEEELVGRIAHGDAAEVDPVVVEAAHRLRGGDGVGEVASALGVDRRVLASRFRSVVGLGMKRYSRVCRFERALRETRRPAAPSLADIAARAGFADQAHMTREFTALSGLTPGTLHGVVGPSPNHVDGEIFKTDGDRASTIDP